MHIFGITVFIQETCLLKAARAFLVFKALEEMGEIIKSVPAVQDIEDEKFEFDFSVIYITKEDIEKVKAAILNVSEIQSAFMEELTVEAEAKQEVKQEETQQVANAPQTASKPKEKPQTKTSKPVVNRSVRVDIEKLDVLMNLVSELIIAKNGLVSASTHDANQGTQGFNEQIEYLERITTNLHESVMKVRMMPIETVVNKFPRMIRYLT